MRLSRVFGSRHLQVSKDDPCVSVCRFEGRTGWCVGCGRTVPEIRAWRKLQPQGRRKILSDLQRRLGKIASRSEA